MSGETKTYIDKTEYLRLQGYLYDLHTSGKVCVFSELSGHTDTLAIRVVDSMKNYSDHIYGDYGSRGIYISADYKRSETDKEIIDRVIDDIELSIEQRDTKIAQLEQQRLETRKKRYEELKAEFEEDKL